MQGMGNTPSQYDMHLPQGYRSKNGSKRVAVVCPRCVKLNNPNGVRVLILLNHLLKLKAVHVDDIASTFIRWLITCQCEN